MNMHDWNFVGRPPRHQADVGESIEVELRRSPGTMPAVVAGELLDFSRQGARLRAEAALCEDETFVISFRPADSGLDLTLPGAVRWRQQDASGRWLYGCEFMEEVPLETLGELFLRGILSVRSPASSG
jgi:hypothetical protein